MNQSHSRSRTRSRLPKRLAFVAGPAVVALLLAGCTGSGASNPSAASAKNEPQTFSFSFGATNNQDKAAYTKMAQTFEKEHKGVKITLENLPSESYATAIATRVQGGNAPDVFYAEGGSGESDAIFPFAKAGYLLKLDDSGIASEMPDSAKSLWVKNGKVYGVPSITQANGEIFNNQLAESIGVHINATTSMDSIISQCKIATKHGKAIFGLAGSVAANTGYLAVGIATSTVYGSDPNWNAQRAAGKVTFAGTKGWVQALTYIKKMYDAGCFQPGAVSAGFDALTNDSTDGTILGFFAPSGAAQEIMQAAGGHVKLVVLPIAAPKGEKTYLSVSSDEGFSASAKTKSPALVQEFLKFWISPKGSQIFASAEGGIPVNATKSTKLLSQYDPVKSQIENQDYRGYAPTGWSNGKVYNDLGEGVQGILTGQETVKQVLQQMDSDWG